MRSVEDQLGLYGEALDATTPSDPVGRSRTRSRHVRRATAVLAAVGLAGSLALAARAGPDDAWPVDPHGLSDFRLATREDVANTAFEVVAIEQDGMELELTQPPPRLEFGQRWMSVVTQCNNSWAPFEISDGQLHYRLDGTTAKGCVGVLSLQERAMYTALFDISVPLDARAFPTIAIAGTTLEVRQRDLVLRGVADGTPRFDETGLSPSSLEGTPPSPSAPG